ncbi:nonstructural protein [Bat-associated densovirus 4]|uniref:Nonstructural protein n=1 Tax=Bat-associated densovirus 4 TaxID=3070186 RepID=A0A7M1PWH1_9VIRU|nr:nonstructural protein [Bat associated densovirus]QOR29555.1 nonstructural protein [Bat-associated densovirus 4]
MRIHPRMVNPLRQNLDQLAGTIQREIRTHFDGTDRWISQIIPECSFALAQELARATELSRHKCKKYRFITIVWHPDTTGGHVHCYHICQYKKSHCNCKAIAVLRAKFQEEQNRTGSTRSIVFKQRGRRRRILYCAGISEKDIKHWLQYYISPPRKIIYMEIGQIESRTMLHRLENLPKREGVEERERSTEAMETCRLSLQEPCNEPDESSVNNEDTESAKGTEEMLAGGSGSVSKHFKRVPTKIIQKAGEHLWLADHIRRLLPVPLSAACDLDEWILDSKLCFYDKSDVDYRRAFTQVQREISLKNYTQLLELHNSVTGTYYARGPDHYLDIDDSFIFVKRLLEHQFGSNVKQSFKDLFDILEKNISKMNTICIVSPPNSGKTWFVDMISAFYINIGQIGNFNKNSAFPLNDCVSKRLLIWNEPNIEPSAYDTCKMLLGGDPCPANVKYQSGHVITKTPVIITTNKEVFPKQDEIWNSRIIFWEWREAPFLKNIHAYPHPLCFPKLVQYFECDQ